MKIITSLSSLPIVIVIDGFFVYTILHFFMFTTTIIFYLKKYQKKKRTSPYKLKTRTHDTRTRLVQAHSAAEWPPRRRKAIKFSSSVQAPYKTQDLNMVILG